MLIKYLVGTYQIALEPCPHDWTEQMVSSSSSPLQLEPPKRSFGAIHLLFLIETPPLQVADQGMSITQRTP